MSRLHHTGITPADAPGYAWRPLFFASITDTRLQYTRTRMGYHDGRVFPVNTISSGRSASNRGTWFVSGCKGPRHTVPASIRTTSPVMELADGDSRKAMLSATDACFVGRPRLVRW